MEGVFRFKSWFLKAQGLIHGGPYYQNFTVYNICKYQIYNIVIWKIIFGA